MKHTVSVLCLALVLGACSKEPEKKNCIDPTTYANICVEQAIREEEAKSSSYLDMKYGVEDKAKEVALAPAAPVSPGPVAATTVPQTVAPKNHSSFIFLPMFLPSSSPAPQTFTYARPAPVRPVQAPSGPSYIARGASPLARLGTALTAPAKPFLPPRPVPTIIRPVQPAKPTVPVTSPKAPVRQIPIVPQAPKPAVIVAPTVAPKPTWTAPKVTVSPSRPSVPSTRSSSSGRR